MRLHRALEEVSKQKEAVRQARVQSKDLGEGQKLEVARLEAQCQRLERQKVRLKCMHYAIVLFTNIDYSVILPQSDWFHFVSHEPILDMTCHDRYVSFAPKMGVVRLEGRGQRNFGNSMRYSFCDAGYSMQYDVAVTSCDCWSKT